MAAFNFPNYPASQKVYVTSELNPEISVPFRQITLSDSPIPNSDKTIPNEPILVYDSSGPYSDPEFHMNLEQGLPKRRDTWSANVTLPSRNRSQMHYARQGIITNEMA